MPGIDMDWAWAIDAGWGQLPVWDLTLRLAIATILGAIIGLERERLDRAAGLRTHALVSVASALIMIVSTYGFPLPPDGVPGVFDPGRVAAQVVSGIGFLGAGVIIFRENTVRGLTTAATLWAVAGVGLASGGGLYVAAAVATAFMLLIQAGLKPVERRFFAKHAHLHRVVLEVDRGADVLESIQRAVQATPVRLRSMEFDREGPEALETIELALLADGQDDVVDLVSRLRTNAAMRHITYRRGASIVGRRERLAPRRTGLADDAVDDDGR